jgi:hypothetical protein
MVATIREERTKEDRGRRAMAREKHPRTSPTRGNQKRVLPWFALSLPGKGKRVRVRKAPEKPLSITRFHP